ncbi:MAG: carboxypeptidase regulatory-like domain-containing protein [Candidatus Cybelea sp.]
MAASHVRAIAAGGGIITGSVIDDKTHAAIAGAKVVASSPSGTYRTVSDAQGNFRFLSVLPDDYSISVTGAGYLPYSTVIVVLNGSQQSIKVVLSKTLKVIAATHARSSGSAFQRGMTIDTYTVTGSQILTVTGKAFNANENDLLRSLPSVTIDKSGTVSIRGGFAFEAAYEFEGIDYTTPTPNLQNSLQNVSNFNLLNGVGSVQLVPGAGDATHGDTGTGLVMFTAKNGTFPSYFHGDVEAGLFPYLHQLGLEWGWADPSQRISNYAGFIGIRQAYQYGINGTAANALGTLGTNAATLGSTIDPNLVYYSPQFLSSDDFVDNLIYRFGHNNGQRLQFFIQNQSITQTLDYGGFQFLPYISGGTTAGKCAPFPVTGPNGPVNLPPQNYACDNLIPLFPGQPNTYAFVSQADTRSSPFLAYKGEYDINLGSTSLLSARYWRTFSGQSQDMPAQGIFAEPFGGTRTAGQIDGTTQLGTKNLLKYGTIYEWVVPYGNRYDFTSYTAFTTPAFIITYPITHPLQPLPLPYTYTGLLPNNNPPAAQGLEKDFFSPAFCAQIAAGSGCGYLSAWFPGGVRFPFEEDVETVAQQQYGTYLQDTIDMSDRWKAEAGLRLDGYNFQIPTQVGAPASVPAVEHQRLYEPHLNASYMPDPRDTIRVGFGHTLSMPLPSLLGGRREPCAVRTLCADSVLRQLDRQAGDVLRTAGRCAVHQLRRSVVLAHPRLPLRQLDLGGAASRSDLHQHRYFLGARVSRRFGFQDHAVLPARLQRHRADRPDRRLQLPNRLAGLRRRCVLQSWHSESHRRRDALHQRRRVGALDAGRRNLHQPVRQRTTRHVLTAGGAGRR